jgi:hypothetical protein
MLFSNWLARLIKRNCLVLKRLPGPAIPDFILPRHGYQPVRFALSSASIPSDIIPADVVFWCCSSTRFWGLASGVVGYAKITFLNFNQRAKGKSVAYNA